MTLDGLKEALFDITDEYFGEGAQIMWDENRKAVKPGQNLVTLKILNVQRSTYYISAFDNGKDEVVDYQPSTAILRVQIFSKGDTRKSGDSSYVVNTAVNDMLDFEHYLLSDYGIMLSEKYNIAIVAGTSVQDISAVLDTAYDFRATQDFEISFMQSFEGRAGINKPKWKPTASGGGTKELAGKRTGYFENVEITETFEDEH